MKHNIFFASLAVALSLTVATASAEEKILTKVPANKVPNEVAEAAKKAIPGFQTQIAMREKFGTQTNYHLQGATGGIEAALVVSEEGKVLEMKQAIEVKSVPAPVSEAAAKFVPGLIVDKAMKAAKTNQPFIELSGRANGKSFIVILSPDAKLLEIDETIQVIEIPKVVTDAAAKAVPGFVADEATKITQTSTISYMLIGKAEGKNYQVKLTADGRILDTVRGGAGNLDTRTGKPGKRN